MPEYILEGRGSEEFRDLPPFTRGYIEAAFFTAPDGSDGGYDMRQMGFHDLSDDALEQIRGDCDRFCSENAADIDRLIAAKDDYDMESAGRDFWFTRNGHGVGFWDRGFTDAAGDASERLTEASTAFGEVDFDVDPDADRPSIGFM